MQVCYYFFLYMFEANTECCEIHWFVPAEVGTWLIFPHVQGRSNFHNLSPLEDYSTLQAIAGDPSAPRSSMGGAFWIVIVEGRQKSFTFADRNTSIGGGRRDPTYNFVWWYFTIPKYPGIWLEVMNVPIIWSGYCITSCEFQIEKCRYKCFK